MIELKFEIDLPDFAEVSRTGLRRCRREALLAGLEWFARTRLPARFKGGTLPRQLNWLTRDPEYNRAKAELRPASTGKPHRFTGSTERHVGATRELKVMRAGAQIIMRRLGWFYGRRRDKRRSGRDELESVARWELEAMARIYANRYTEALQEELRTRRRRRRVN